MDLTQLFAHIPVVIRELWGHKFSVLLCFAVVSLAVLFVGMTWTATFVTSTTIYADNQNILKPLLERSAAVTRIQDRIRVVRDVIHSPRILRDVVTELNSGSDLSPIEMEKAVNQLRQRIKLEGLGSSYIKISYSDQTADRAFDVLNTVVDKFIRDSSDSKRAESKEAFIFIDNQVRQYKAQLLTAEENLKIFNSDNFDGGGAAVAARIAQLRSDIEEMKIDVDESKTRVAVIAQQLKKENRYSARAYKADVYRKRMDDLQQRINTLLLTYQESYPDVVSLRLQLEDLKVAIREAEAEDAAVDGQALDGPTNPYYEELRSKLADANVEVNTQVRRLQATERLLQEEYERRKRVAANQAELAELNRDYNVTKRIYDDMLERKEKARLSMTLNVEGQGVHYKIQEPAVYPLKPTGISFRDFVILGPIVAALIPLLLAIAYILLDPRIRFPDECRGKFDVPILAVIPQSKNALNQRVFRIDVLLFLFGALLIMSVYGGLAYANKIGLILGG